MRKNLFLIFMASLAIYSCSNDETTSINKGNVIDFRTSVVSRASETTTANLSKINVTAIQIDGVTYFDDVVFSKVGTSSTFTSESDYYWPEGNVEFFAYSPTKTELGGTLTLNSSIRNLADFSPNTDISQQVDFISDSIVGNKTTFGTTGIPLQFEHRLAQIEVRAKYTGNNYKYTIYGVRIGKPVSKGTFDFDSQKWTLASDKINYTAQCDIPFVLVSDHKSIMKSEGENAMIIPQQLTKWDVENDKTNTNNGAYLGILLKIETTAGKLVYPTSVVTAGRDWATIPIDTNWEAGKKYTYILDFTYGAGYVDPDKPEPTDPKDPYNPGDKIFKDIIRFNVAVTDWDTTQGSINTSM